VTVYPQRGCMRLHKWGGVHRFFGRRPGLGAKHVLLSGQTSAFAAGYASHNGATCTAYFRGRPDPRGEAYAFERADLRFRRGSRLPQAPRALHIFLWEARPRGEACALERADPPHSPRVAPPHGAACNAYFCGRPDLGAKLMLLSGQALRFRRGSRLPQWCRVHCIFSVGGPPPGAKLMLLSGQTSAFAAGRASHNGAACTAYFSVGGPTSGRSFFWVRAGTFALRRASHNGQLFH